MQAPSGGKKLGMRLGLADALLHAKFYRWTVPVEQKYDQWGGMGGGVSVRGCKVKFIGYGDEWTK